MRDVFHEETVEIVDRAKAKRKYDLFNILNKISYFCAVIWAIIATFFPIGDLFFWIFGILPIVIFIVGGVMLGKARDSFYVEYDYRFLSGEVVISKVINAKKRQKGFKFRCIDLERFGVYNSETYKKYEKMPNVIKSNMTSNVYPEKNKNFFFVVFTDKDKKRLLIMECTNKLISYMMSYCNKFVFDEELKNL